MGSETSFPKRGFKRSKFVLPTLVIMGIAGCLNSPRPVPLPGLTAEGGGVVEVRVATSSDDAEESASGSLSVSSSDLELIRDSSDQQVGMRFAGVAIPVGATITNAYVQFKTDKATSEATSLVVQGQATDNAPIFSSSNKISSRAKTAASVTWTPAAWTTVGETGPNQRTPDLASVVQEIVNRPAWASGHALALIVTGSGKRVAKSFNGDAAGAPLLHVEYSTEDVPPPPPPPASSVTLEARIATSSDDAEESATGSLSASSSDLELIRDSSDQQVGMRFAGLTLPTGATVTNAYLQFKTDKVTSEATSLVVQGQATDNAPTFSSSNKVSTRAKTAASVAWSPAAWSTVGEVGPNQRTPDLTSVVQEIVSRPGWASGNALALIITGSGKRVAKSFNGDAAGAPLLHVEYTTSTGGGNTPPQVDSFTAAPNLVATGQAVTFTWAVSDPEGSALSCTLDVDSDGTSEYTVSDCEATTTQTHSYSTSGQYTARLSVKDSGDAAAEATTTVQVVATPTPSSVVVAAAGDIACDPTSSYFSGTQSLNHCQMGATSSLMLEMNLDAVLPLGDNVYEEGTLEQYSQSYDPSWGRLKNITFPAVGNHEYLTPNGTGYFQYFGAAAGDPSKAYYSFDIGAWHIVVLNSSCSQAGGCKAWSPQTQWLRNDLAAHPTACTLAYWHIPRFSSGRIGNRDFTRDLWAELYNAGADLVLTGHDHNYERFAPQTADGQLDLARGLREFVVGTGGKSTLTGGTPQPNSEAFNNDTTGVLKLTLNPTSYDWQFVPIPGKTFTDSGSGQCH